MPVYPWNPYKNLDSLTCIDLLSTNAFASKFSKYMSLRNRAARFSFNYFVYYEGKIFKKLQPRNINYSYRSYKDFSNGKCNSCSLNKMKIKKDFVKNDKGFETFCNKKPVWSVKVFIQFLYNDIPSTIEILYNMKLITYIFNIFCAFNIFKWLQPSVQVFLNFFFPAISFIEIY